MSFDKHINLTPEQIASIGIQRAAQAQSNLELIGDRLGHDFVNSIRVTVIAALSASADPDMACNNLERFVHALTDITLFKHACKENPDVLASLMTIFGASHFLSSFLIATADEQLASLSSPSYLAHAPGKKRFADQLSSLVAEVDDDRELFRVLRMFRKQEMLRIGLRDLLGRADLQETVAELSDLAEVCLQQAYLWMDTSLRKRYGRPVIADDEGNSVSAGFAIIAMGKLGGRELNFSSDVDLMYVYQADGETEGGSSPDHARVNRISNHQYFIKLAEKISAAIGEKTEDGFVFRVDLRLRPEGQRGPLAQSLGGYEIYYESWGQTWERSALIKARPVAGDEVVGREFLLRITPFVYRKYLDFSALAEIRDMKQKINKDVEQKGRTHLDVKLGYGGIREIEFIVQALQLIYAGRDRSLREKSTLKALHRLSQKGLITYQEHSVLARAYIFLRTVEHRIQILDDLQTQTLPTEPEDLRRLARSAGYCEGGRETKALLGDHRRHTRLVRSIYDDLFAFTGEETETAGTDDTYALLLDVETSEQDAVKALGVFGFRDPGKAYRNLILLREGPAFVHQTPRNRKLFNSIFPVLFREIVASIDPDMAFNHLESFLAAQGSWEVSQSIVKLDAEAVKVFVTVFANSGYLSRMLISRPMILQNLLDARRSPGLGTTGVFGLELEETLGKHPELTEKLDALRRFKNQEELRIGMADLLSGMSLPTVCRELSKLAEVCLKAALDMAAAETGRKHDRQGSFDGLAIVAVGKLGGRELTYGSDLDVLFVYSDDRALPPPGLSAFEYLSRMAEKTISYLVTLTREGCVFRVDTRLRPTGSKGPLVQSIEAFRQYYSTQADTWERQALLRARFVAGDRDVGDRFSETLRSLIYQKVDPVALAGDIRVMRKRIEDELGKTDASRFNIKQGEGGLVDIEFLVQFLQLQHGHEHPRLRVPGTWNGLKALRSRNLLSSGDYHILKDAYLFLRLIESRLRVVTNQATSELSRDPLKLQPLARRMGYVDTEGTAGQRLLEDYEKTSKSVREVFIRQLDTAVSV